MVYEWDDKLDDAYRLYVVERLSLDQVMDWFRREKGFAPRYVFGPPYMADVRYGRDVADGVFAIHRSRRIP